MRNFIISVISSNEICVCVCVCVCDGVLRRFQQDFIHMTMVAACCTRCDSSCILSAANTDALCHRHKARSHHQVRLSCHWANQSWLYPLNAECIAKKQPVPILTPLVWHGWGLNPRSPNYEANTLSTRPPNR